MRGWLAGVAIAMGACGPDPVPDADVDPLCGKQSAVRVLPLEADEMPSSYGGGIVRLDDRIYYVVGDAVTESDAPYGDGPLSAELPHPRAPRVMSTFSCGEFPQVIAEGIEGIFIDERWPHALFGHEAASGDLMVLDRYGYDAPRRLLPATSSQRATDVGWVRIAADADDPTVGRVFLQRYPVTLDAPLSSEVELDTGGLVELESVHVLDTEVLLINTAGELRKIDLTTRQSLVLFNDATSLALADEGRFLVMTLRDHADPEGPKEVVAVDRTNADVHALATAPSDFRVFPFSADDGVALRLFPSGQRVVSFPSLAAVDLGDDPQLSSAVADGVFLATHDGQTVVYVVATGLSLPAPSFPTAFDVDAFELTELAAGSPVSPYRMSGPLWRVPYSGSPRELLANRVGRSHERLTNGRLLTVLDVDSEFLGTLVTIDPDTLEEQPIDERVFGIDVDLAAPGVFEDGVIAYGVRDGDRSGVWLAKPAPLGD